MNKVEHLSDQTLELRIQNEVLRLSIGWFLLNLNALKDFLLTSAKGIIPKDTLVLSVVSLQRLGGLIFTNFLE